MLDGDGTISRIASFDKNRWIIALVSGSKPVIEAWHDFVMVHTGCYRELSFGRGVWYTNYAPFTVPQAMARLFYEDLKGSIPLARKKEVADQLLSIQSGKKYNPPALWGDTAQRSLQFPA